MWRNQVGAHWVAQLLWPPMVCGGYTRNLPAGGSISEQEGDSSCLGLIKREVQSSYYVPEVVMHILYRAFH